MEQYTSLAVSSNMVLIRMNHCTCTHSNETTDSSCYINVSDASINDIILINYKPAILKKELLLRKSRYRHTAQQYN